MKVEIAYRAQPPDDDGGLSLAAKLNQQIRKPLHLDILELFARRFGHYEPLFMGKHRTLFTRFCDGHDNLVEQVGGTLYDIEMPVCDRVESARIDHPFRSFFHDSSILRFPSVCIESVRFREGRTICL